MSTTTETRRNEAREETISPKEVYRAIARALTGHALAAANGLYIGALRGEVMICGDVSSNLEKQILTEAARRVPGVTRVDCRVEVRDSTGPRQEPAQ